MSQDSVEKTKNKSPIKRYFSKWVTKKRVTLKVPGISSLIWTFIGAVIGISFVAYIGLETNFSPLFAPFGASAVLLYGPINAPFSQPRSLIGGHVLSALVGVIIFKLFGISFIAIALAVAIAIVLMKLTKTVHPPAGATALLGVTVSGGSFMWVLMPVLLGASILLVVALVVNNFDKNISYPDYWF